VRISNYHPANEIRGLKGRVLSGCTIVLGLTGSSAIYRSIDVARELIRRGARVIPVLSREAAKLVSPELFRWATGEEVFTEFSGEVGHIALSREASSMLICPATLNTISKVVNGIGDTTVTLVAMAMLGNGKPVIIVPAMHYNLWHTYEKLKLYQSLSELGITVVPPVISEGKAKIAGINDVVAAVEAVTLRGRDLSGLRILVTAGATREWLDRVRFLTNPSTGKMGLAIAREAYFRGAEVTLIHGFITGDSVPHYIKSINVSTTEEMAEAVVSEVRSKEYDAVILAAAPTDFKFSKVFSGRLSASDAPLSIELVATPKISLIIRNYFKGLVVGFSAEYAEGSEELLVSNAIKKMKERLFDIIVANDVSRTDIGFASDYNEVYIIHRDGEVVKVSKTLKSEVARRILDEVKKMLGG